MPDTLILGTIALDNIETPFGKQKEALGGSATYASYAASFFSSPAIVSIIGKDFPQQHKNLLKNRNICLKGVAIGDKTFRWDGFYEFDMNEAKTLRTELNVLESFQPMLPEDYKNIEYILLGNLDPDIQLAVLSQLKKPALVITDTMNFWIEHKKDKLLEVIKKTGILLLNDGEARQLFKTANLVSAATKALKLGPKAVVIKKGEHGALLFTKDKHFNAPGYPLETVKDPTGCGASFGGALVGYLAKTKDHSEANLRKAIVYASAIASFNAEDFSLNNLKKIKHHDIEKRFNELREIRNF